MDKSKDFDNGFKCGIIICLDYITQHDESVLFKVKSSKSLQLKLYTCAPNGDPKSTDTSSMLDKPVSDKSPASKPADEALKSEEKAEDK